MELDDGGQKEGTGRLMQIGVAKMMQKVRRLGKRSTEFLPG